MGHHMGAPRKHPRTPWEHNGSPWKHYGIVVLPRKNDGTTVETFWKFQVPWKRIPVQHSSRCRHRGVTMKAPHRSTMEALWDYHRSTMHHHGSTMAALWDRGASTEERWDHHGGIIKALPWKRMQVQHAPWKRIPVQHAPCRTHHGSPVGSPWKPQGIITWKCGHDGKQHGITVEASWDHHGSITESSWEPHGIAVGAPWDHR